ncbi:hypothetical protein H1215_12070, partial [Anoxybacillus sp. LAT_38]
YGGYMAAVPFVHVMERYFCQLRHLRLPESCKAVVPDRCTHMLPVGNRRLYGQIVRIVWSMLPKQEKQLQQHGIGKLP